MQNKPHSTFNKTLVGGACWLLVWQLASKAVGSALLLPPPLSVLSRFLYLATQKDFYVVLWFSLSRIGAGFLLGCVIGSLLGIGMAISDWFRQIMSIPLGAIKAAPIASFVILALIWIPSRNLSVFISFLMVLPIFAQNTYSGLVNIDKQIIEMANIYKIPFLRRIRRIYIPYLSTYWLPALQVSIGMSWKAGIAAEVLAIPQKAVGTQLYNAKVYLETPDLFAWTFTIIGLSLILEWIATQLLGGILYDKSK